MIGETSEETHDLKETFHPTNHFIDSVMKKGFTRRMQIICCGQVYNTSSEFEGAAEPLSPFFSSFRLHLSIQYLSEASRKMLKVRLL